MWASALSYISCFIGVLCIVADAGDISIAYRCVRRYWNAHFNNFLIMLCHNLIMNWLQMRITISATLISQAFKYFVEILIDFSTFLEENSLDTIFSLLFIYSSLLFIAWLLVYINITINQYLLMSMLINIYWLMCFIITLKLYLVYSIISIFYYC